MKKTVVIGVVCLVIIALLAFGVYTVYGEREAVMNLEVQIYDVSVPRIGLTSADISVKLRFYNPTQFSTPSFRVEYDIYLADSYIGHGSIPDTKVPASSSIIQTMTITVSYLDVAKSLIEALIRGDFSVSVKGTVHARLFFDMIPISRSFSA